MIVEFLCWWVSEILWGESNGVFIKETFVLRGYKFRMRYWERCCYLLSDCLFLLFFINIHFIWNSKRREKRNSKMRKWSYFRRDLSLKLPISNFKRSTWIRRRSNTIRRLSSKLKNCWSFKKHIRKWWKMRLNKREMPKNDILNYIF